MKFVNFIVSLAVPSKVTWAIHQIIDRHSNRDYR